MKSDAAVDALLRAAQKGEPEDVANVLRALGATQSSRALGVLQAALSSRHTVIRVAALDAMPNFPPEQASKALRPFTSDQDLDFRERVVRTWAERLRQPIDPNWLVEVIKARNGERTLGDALRLLRLYAGDRAAVTMLKCLDFENPAVRSYYNQSLLSNQVACRRALVVPWISDLNRDGTPEEIIQNRQTLRRVKQWLAYYDERVTGEPPEPGRLPTKESEETWGIAVDQIRIRAYVNRSIWHPELPQVIVLEAENQDGSSAIFGQWPPRIEVQLNGLWYRYEGNQAPEIRGEWRGRPHHVIQLGAQWRRITDGTPLTLPPGKFTARVRLSRLPANERTGLATSKPFSFEVQRIGAEQ